MSGYARDAYPRLAEFAAAPSGRDFELVARRRETRRALDEIDQLRSLIAEHRPITERLLPFDCYQGNCDDPEHLEAGECPEVEVQVCAACHALAMEINDEITPNEVLADRCPICVYVHAAQLGRSKFELRRVDL